MARGCTSPHNLAHIEFAWKHMQTFIYSSSGNWEVCVLQHPLWDWAYSLQVFIQYIVWVSKAWMRSGTLWSSGLITVQCLAQHKSTKTSQNGPWCNKIHTCFPDYWVWWLWWFALVKIIKADTTSCGIVKEGEISVLLDRSQCILIYSWLLSPYCFKV